MKPIVLPAVLFMTFAAAVPLAAQTVPETKLNVVGSIGVLSMHTDMEVPFWKETMPELSGGAILANLRSFSELGFNGSEPFSLVSNGTLQMAHQALPYTAGAVPINEAIDLVGVAENVEDVQKSAEAFRHFYAGYLSESHNIKLLGFGTYQSQVVYCRAPFESLADLRGRKIRAAGSSQQVFVEYLGASSIGMAFAEVPTSLSNGTIDCAITGALSGYQARWYDAASHISTLPINHGVIAHIANLDWWDSLDPAVQSLLENGLAELESRMFALAATETEDGLACNTGGSCPYGQPARMVLVTASDTDLALSKEAAAKAVLPAFKARCGDECAAAWNQTIGAAMGLSIE